MIRSLYILLCLGVAAPACAQQQSTEPIPAPTHTTAAGVPVVLTWKDASNNEIHFVMQRRPADSLTWATIAYLHWDTTTYTDWQTTAGRYCYRVASENYQGVSDPSNEVCVTVTLPALAPPVIEYSTCCVTTTDPKGVPVITWPPPPPGVSIHMDRRWRSGSEPWVRLTGPVAAEGVWHDHGTNLNAPYCYRARFAEKDKDDTELSNRVCSND